MVGEVRSQSPSKNITHSPDQRPDADNTRAPGEVKTTNKDPQYMSTDVFLADRQVSVRGSHNKVIRSSKKLVKKKRWKS